MEKFYQRWTAPKFSGHRLAGLIITILEQKIERTLSLGKKKKVTALDNFIDITLASKN